MWVFFPHLAGLRTQWGEDSVAVWLFRDTHSQLPPYVPHRHASREKDAGQPGADVEEVRGRVLIDAVVHQQLGDQGGQEGDGDPKAKAASRAVKRPPKAQRQGRQCQGELNVIGKIQFL